MLLFRINAKIDTDQLEIISFQIKSEEIFRKKVHIFRILKSSEIRYISNSSSNCSDEKQSLIYLLVNTGTNYFFSLNYDDGKITELAICTEIGLSPSLMKLNEKYLIAFGGVNSDTINIYDCDSNKWHFVGKLSIARTGAYALLNNYDNQVYICGGQTQEGDNTLEVESFSMECFYEKVLTTTDEKVSYENKNKLRSKQCLNFNFNLSNTMIEHNEVKIKKIKDDFLLRKIYPVVIPLYDDNTYLICGGSNIFEETNTCSVFFTDREMIHMTSVLIPKSFNSPNPNVFFYKTNVYFFVSDNELIKYSTIDNNFELIAKEIINL